MTLYLLPNLLDESLPWEPFLPQSVSLAVRSLDGLIAESEKMGRRYLRRFVDHDQMAKTAIRCLNEHTEQKEIASLLEGALKGENWGVISDAGLPCIADPGTELVFLAHQKRIKVVAFPGPSSILMALQLSGLCGQRFTFHGYLPREEEPLKRALAQLEAKSKQEKSSQIWIETPYRLSKMARIAIETLESSTCFCVAQDLTMESESVRMQPIALWRKASPSFEKRPAVFLLQSR